jgi:hypothetical protein
MIGMTAFRTMSHEFACFAEWHGGGGRSTARRQDKANFRSRLARLAKCLSAH